MKGLWRIAIVVAAVLALAGTAVGFVAAQTEDGDGPESKRDAFVELLAGNLGITPEELQSAITQTQLDLVDEALAAGRIDEDQAAQIRERIESGEGRVFGPGGGHHRPGPRAGCHGLVYQVSEILDVPFGEVVSALQDGMSLAQIAEANGVSADDLAAALLANVEEHVARAVEAGKITQERGDQIVANAAEKIGNAINHEGPLPCQRPHAGFPDGGVRFPGGVGDAPAISPSLDEI